MNTKDEMDKHFKQDCRTTRRFLMQVYACINFSCNDDLVLRKHVLSTCGFAGTPKMKVPPQELSEERECEIHLRLVEAENPNDLISVIKLLGVGTETWRAAVRRLKNMLMGKPVWA